MFLLTSEPSFLTALNAVYNVHVAKASQQGILNIVFSMVILYQIDRFMSRIINLKTDKLVLIEIRIKRSKINL